MRVGLLAQMRSIQGTGRIEILDKRSAGEEPKKVNDMSGNPVHGKAGNPGWASGLRQLYDAVVDEPLPDSFKDLLSKLDDKN